MKQGRATSNKSAGTQPTPVSRGVNVEHAASIGLKHIRTVNLPMYEGRGIEAPMQHEESYESGSQGKYK
jgi:hypothetical protein